MASKILFTGFEPFLDLSANASWEGLVRMFERHPELKDNIAIELMPVVYAEIRPRLEELLDKHQPELLVSLGVHSGGESGGRKLQTFYVEKFAYNQDNTSRPDNAGDIREGIAIDGTQPLDETLSSTISVESIAQSIGETGADAQLSTDPGRYLCNHIYYVGLQLAAIRDHTFGVNFVHVPPSEEVSEGALSLDSIADAYASLANSLLGEFS